MMGGGFGGCTINLVEKGAKEQVVKTIKRRYKNQFGINVIDYSVKIVGGLKIVINEIKLS
jgi:galactokinase